MRKMGSKQATIQDLRNPRAPDQKFYFKKDKAAGLINLYTNIFTPIKFSILPPLDLRPFTYWDGKIYGVRGATGNPEDDSIALLRRPIVSMVECAETGKLLADAIQNTIEFYDTCKKYDIGDEVTFKLYEPAKQGMGEKFMNRHHEDTVMYNGVISSMGNNGLEVTVATTISKKIEHLAGAEKQQEDVSETQYMKYLFLTKQNIHEAEMTIIKKSNKPSLPSVWICSSLQIG